MSDPQTLGLPTTVPFGGRDWRVGEATFAVEAAFAEWLQLEAFRTVEQYRPRMGERWYAEHSAGARQDVASKVYAWGGHRCFQALYSPEGCKQMAFLRLLAGEEPGYPVGPELVERMWADPACRERLQALVWGEGPGPNSSGPTEGPSPSTPSAPSSSGPATGGTRSAG
jgi:hypothetical protein